MLLKPCYRQTSQLRASIAYLSKSYGVIRLTSDRWSVITSAFAPCLLRTLQRKGSMGLRFQILNSAYLPVLFCTRITVYAFLFALYSFSKRYMDSSIDTDRYWKKCISPWSLHLGFGNLGYFPLERFFFLSWAMEVPPKSISFLVVTCFFGVPPVLQQILKSQCLHLRAFFPALWPCYAWLTAFFDLWFLCFSASYVMKALKFCI